MPELKIQNKETVNTSCKVLMTVASFKSSTKLTMKSRGRLLNFIEAKLATINKIQDKDADAKFGPDALLVMAELYYALDRWLVLAGRKDESVNTRRSTGVNALFAQVVKLLSYQLETPINQLPNWLQDNFTIGMTDHGYEVDFQKRSALYYKEQDRERYRLKIKNGVVYQKKWWSSKDSTKWVKMNSEFTQSTGSQNTISDKHCGYVLSVVGDFYSGPHLSGTTYKQTGQYHSSYMGGKPVLCAGEIEVVEGKIKHLNTGSGHYGPAKGYLLNVINALTLCGVDPKSYKVNYHGSKTAYTGATMLEKIESEDKKVGDDNVSHHKSKIAAKYNNGVLGRLKDQMNKIEKQLAVIAHFGTSEHKEGITRRGGSRKAICSICSSANLDNQMQQDRYKQRDSKALQLEYEKLEKLVARIK
ncbi:hypothetical protein [Litoribrevibacter albus]|uniref:Uncharacterized protein n=1 Tax=Litoribrevibacter albus TaxID=1473156 RepID=A0AA37SE17_9GAMM|nr:hypothetical protein [Litoribrevibacter albus]GLQ32871.1 hypothetical protein GCM10007876_33500 [Litoribrevibacter albus]